MDNLWIFPPLWIPEPPLPAPEEEKSPSFHTFFHIVKKQIYLIHKGVDKSEKVCYNCGMQSPDVGRIEDLLQERAEKFEIFSRLLMEYNKKFNLTAITAPEEVKVKHFFDSLAGEAYLPAGARVAEVGSGAGFPSIPLMIAREDLSFTLIESTGKKCNFLRIVQEELGLRAEIVCGRAEEVAREQAYREAFDVAVARAVAKLNTLAEYCLPLVKKGGAMIAYKTDGGELAGARRAISLLGGGNARTAPYELPQGMGARALVLIDKVKPTPQAYPRGHGKERSAPLA